MQAVIIPQSELENLRFGDRIKKFVHNHGSQIAHGAEAAAKFGYDHRKEIGDVAKAFRLQQLEEEELENLKFGDRIKKFWHNHGKQIEHGAEEAGKIALHVAPIAAAALA